VAPPAGIYSGGGRGHGDIWWALGTGCCDWNNPDKIMPPEK
jgi:hypothetical protein